MKHATKLGLWIILGIVFILIVGSIWGYNIGKQEEFPPNALLANPSGEEANIPASENEIIVQYKETTSEEEQVKIEEEIGVTEEKIIDETAEEGETKVLKAAEGQNSHELVTEFRQEHGDEIEYAELNGIMEPLMVPNDPKYPNQWALPKIEAPSGWDTTEGSPDITIAVLDTGVNESHPDLKNKLVQGYNVVDNNTDLTDLHGHGTLMMGIAGAQTNNSIGIAGTAINPKIMMLRISNNAYGWAYWSDMAEAIVYAADHDVEIVSISFGGTSVSATVQNAVNYAYSKGVFIAASAGNSNSDVKSYPAAYNHVVSVAATTTTDTKASFSNFGSWIDIASPGVSIYSTNSSGSYSYVSGTSPACPIVAGVAALVKSQNPNLSPDEVEGYIENFATDIGEPGRDDIFGWGRINMSSSLGAIGNPVPPTYGTILGTVTNAGDNNTPIIGASISLLRSGQVVSTSKTASNGTYQFTGLATGEYNIQVSANGFDSASSNATVAAGEETTVNFQLIPQLEKGAIKGRVLYKQWYWKWTGTWWGYRWRWRAIPNAKVQLKMISANRRSDRITRTIVTRTDENGRYIIRNLSPGEYVVFASYRAQFGAKQTKVESESYSIVNIALSDRNINRWIKNTVSNMDSGYTTLSPGNLYRWIITNIRQARQ